MLRVIQKSHVGGAKNYYTTADYYSEGQELVGRWQGEGARMLGLAGNVTKAEWDALCDNLHPKTGEQLTARMRSGRTVGYDFNWHVPKSVSLLYGETKDERLLDVFREAVDTTMQDIEAEMQTRVRKSGKNENRTTGNAVWGEYVHLTSRPVDGVPDPHLHAHCFVFNTTFDEREDAWKAGQFRNLKRDAPYFEAVFHSRLAGALRELGLPIERTKTGWELSGVDRDLVEKFSRRTAEIEQEAREKGIDDPKAKDGLGAKTREHKDHSLSFGELQDEWRGRMTGDERAVLNSLEERLGGEAEPREDGAAKRAVQYALDHCFERKSVIPERQFLAVALKQSVGQASAEEIQREADRRGLITAERKGRRMVTSREVLDEERKVIGFARDGRGACRPFARHHDTFNREWLNQQQKDAVRHIMESRDRVILLRGASGVGKTTLIEEAVEQIEETGAKVFAFAPSARASRRTLRDAGFEDADTVARLLVDEDLQRRLAGQVVLIDEAGLLGMKTTARLFELAERYDFRVILSGDRRQHASVERGAALRLLEEEAGLVPAEVKEIQRQSGEYKEAVNALSEGRATEGFDRLDRLGWIHEVAAEDRYARMAADYVEVVESGQTALVISPTHSEGRRITEEIRRHLRDSGKIGRDEREFNVLQNANLTEAERGDQVNYAPGDVLVFHQNARGVTRGTRIPVEKDRILPLGLAEGFNVYHSSTLSLSPGDVVRITKNGWTADGEHRVYNGDLRRIKRFDDQGRIVFDNGWTLAKDFGHLAHGYVITSHAAQGSTVDVALVGQSSESFPASNREQFYVSASRARKRMAVYTDDKQALKQAIDRSDDRLTATELIAGTPQREAVALHRRYPQMPLEILAKEKEREFVHEM